MIIIALIVTYNRLEKLKICVEATKIAKFDKIVIVDNASSDGTSEWLKIIEGDLCKVITSDVNSGGAGGFKLGLEFIKNHLEGDWVALYDDDAYPDENIIKNFSIIDKYNYSALSCRVVNFQGQICEMNLPFRKVPESIKQDIHYLLNASHFQPSTEHYEECETLSFVGSIIKRDLIASSLPFLHDDLFIYYDDLFISFHLSKLGHKFLYCPDLIFTHDVSINNGIIIPEWKVYYLVRNLLLSLHIFSSKRPFTIFGIFLRTVKYLLLILKQPDKKRYISFFARGVNDGVRGRRGKRF